MSEEIIFDWPDLGKLEISVGNRLAVLSFSVAESLIKRRALELSKPSTIGFQNELKTNQIQIESSNKRRQTTENESNDYKFKSLSRKAQTDIRKGSLDEYATDLIAMIELFLQENRYVDALKSSMIVFYYYVSGVPANYLNLKRMIITASKLSGMDKADIGIMFRNTIRKDILPYQIISVSESCDRFLDLCYDSFY